ncbi:FMN-linked oxidoreductase [Xylona heveae TC161]|uniref:tRNA-dihydrouridine(16/17) synthase [NAD(P)(+)] n=1 Tax=Xylona heveae (strain CBS 132557 / TC161) TaxID=1328760 RepID=A0A165HW48_XYLHT|nr:FMN-linked oxidoreductase [Xylona heveae TC161]KZF24008.1 FMN-linked oxidoreductase [Xylona heveae TC161]
MTEIQGLKKKLFGREFYESIGSPKVILAPMVDQSEFAWRMLSRSFFPAESKTDLLAYTPMFHSRLFGQTPAFREKFFQPIREQLATPEDNSYADQHLTAQKFLDGNPECDRPLFVQFCANQPDEFLRAARFVQPYCDAVDLNLGCPQGIARKGYYGSFLQENWDLIYKLIQKLHTELDIPITVKFRIQETKEKTLEYAKMIISAGASIITVHGRQREQKGHNTGLADWTVLRYVRDNIPPEVVMFANGNILQHEDIEKCLQETGVDGVMSAEGNLCDPSIFAPPPPIGQEGREYWRGKDGKGGYRMDAVFRRYLDIIHKYVLEQPVPERVPLFARSEDSRPAATILEEMKAEAAAEAAKDDDSEPPNKRQKREKQAKATSPNLVAMQAHLFHLLRPLVSKHTDIRDALARSRPGDMASYEKVLSMVQKAVKQGLLEYELDPSAFHIDEKTMEELEKENPGVDVSSALTIARVKRPWFICQPYVRPLPKEAIEKGAMSLSKKDKAKLEKDENLSKQVGVEPEGKVEKVYPNGEKAANGEKKDGENEPVEIPKEGVVCG